MRSDVWVGLSQVEIYRWPAVISLTNSAATSITNNAAALNGVLVCSGAVYDVYGVLEHHQRGDQCRSLGELGPGRSLDQCRHDGSGIHGHGTEPGHDVLFHLSGDERGGNAVGDERAEFHDAGGGEFVPITANGGAGGTISPSGAVSVNAGANQGFTITAGTGYGISNVVVDSVSLGAISSYTFTNVNHNHAISAAFALMPPVLLATNLTLPREFQLSRFPIPFWAISTLCSTSTT